MAGSSQPDNVGHLVDDYQHDMVAVNQVIWAVWLVTTSKAW